MEYINKIKGNITIIADEEIKAWDPILAKEKVLKALKNNDNKVNAILAPNDKLALSSAEALKELGITAPVIITVSVK